MRDIDWRDIVRREAFPIGVFALVLLILLLIAGSNNREDLGDGQIAVAWTLNLVGAVIAALAAFGLFWRALNAEPLDRQFGFVIVLLAGLLLYDIEWSLAIALGAIGIALILREIFVPLGPERRRGALSASSDRLDPSLD